MIYNEKHVGDKWRIILSSYIFDISQRDSRARSQSIKWIIRHLSKSKLQFAYMIFGSLTIIILSTIIPLLVGNMIDYAIKPKNSQKLFFYIVLITSLGILRIVMSFLSVYINNKISWSSIERIRVEFFEKIQSKPLRFHNRIASGDLMALATQDMQQLGGMINPGINMIIQAFVGLALVVIFSFSVNIQYTLFLLPFFILYLFSIRWYNNSMRPLSQLFNYKWSMISRSAQESITGVRVVRAFNGEQLEMKKFKNVVLDFKDTWFKRQLLQAKYWPILVIYSTIGFSFILSVIFFNNNWITFGEIVGINGMLLLLVQPTFIISFAVSMFQQGLAGGERIFHTMFASEEEEKKSDHKISWPDSINGSIEFKDVSFKYEGAENFVLKNVSFKIEPNETVAIVGPTGSGKTSLTKIISRFYNYEGEIFLGGYDVQDFKLRDLRQNIGRVEQDIFLFSTTINDNIRFGIGEKEETDEEIISAAKTAQAHEFIMEQPEGYETILGERGVGLSGGQKQRIAIARCILTDPKFLILDDSTSAIDAATEEKISNAMKYVMKNRTTLLITHRLSAIRNADKIIVLLDGSVAAIGSHSELITSSEAYRRIFRNSIELPPLIGGME